MLNFASSLRRWLVENNLAGSITPVKGMIGCSLHHEVGPMVSNNIDALKVVKQLSRRGGAIEEGRRLFGIRAAVDEGRRLFGIRAAVDEGRRLIEVLRFILGQGEEGRRVIGAGGENNRGQRGGVAPLCFRYSEEGRAAVRDRAVDKCTKRSL
jgi:hypothetical protein